MARAESVLEKLYQVDLAACLGEHIEILIVDVDVTVDMSLCDVLRKHIVIYVVLGTFRAILEHCAH